MKTQSNHYKNIKEIRVVYGNVLIDQADNNLNALIDQKY